MTPRAPECLRCRSTMERGFVIDQGPHPQSGKREWIEGAPQPSFWSGVKTKGKRVFPVLTFRCTRCGALESYATPRDGAPE